MLVLFGLTCASCGPSQNRVEQPRRIERPPSSFTETELRRILRHSPLPAPRDPTNRFLLDPGAAHLGQRLFYDKRLSSNGSISCAHCHDPAHGFADGKPLSEGIAAGSRHTPTLWNAVYNRWYFWDGRADSLWSQALHPIENPIEMGFSRLAVAHVIANDGVLRPEYAAIFGQLPDISESNRFPPAGSPATAANPSADTRAWDAMSPDDQMIINRICSNAAKAIAAYESILISRSSPFDAFVEGLRSGDESKLGVLSPSARRGLKLFVGSANCRVCHMGPNFTDGEFHDTRVPPLDGGQPVDAGRFAGIDVVKRDPFNARGAFSDDQTGAAVEFLINNPDNWGRFKTPSLRNVALTAPYMHQGQFKTLREVVSFYSTLDGATPAGHHAETILQPLMLSNQEIDDLVAFLESLTDDAIDPALKAPIPD